MEGLAGLRLRRPFASRPNAHRGFWWKPVVKNNPYKFHEKEREEKKLKNRCHLRNTGLLEKNHCSIVDIQLFQAVGKSGQSCRLHLVL